MLLGAETASQMRLVKQLASNPIGRQIIKQQLRGGTVSKPKYR